MAKLGDFEKGQAKAQTHITKAIQSLRKAKELDFWGYTMEYQEGMLKSCILIAEELLKDLTPPKISGDKD